MFYGCFNVTFYVMVYGCFWYVMLQFDVLWLFFAMLYVLYNVIL